MLRGEEKEAVNLATLALRHLARFFSVDHLAGALSKTQLAQLDINAASSKRMGLQCNLDKVDGFTKFNVLQARQLGVLDELIA